MPRRKTFRGSKTEIQTETGGVAEAVKPKETEQGQLDKEFFEKNFLENFKKKTSKSAKRKLINEKLLGNQNYRGVEFKFPTKALKIPDSEKKELRKKAVISRMNDLERLSKYLTENKIDISTGTQIPPESFEYNPNEIINLFDLNNEFKRAVNSKYDSEDPATKFKISDYVGNPPPPPSQEKIKGKTIKIKVEKSDIPPPEKKRLKGKTIKIKVAKSDMPGTPPLEPVPEEEESKEEMKQEETKEQEQEPPTMSPDERDEKEEEEKQEQLSEQKKEIPTTKREPRMNIATFKSKMESIPESRLGTQGKEINELIDDIEFFLKEFPSQLKSEKTIFNKVDKNNKNDLIKLHTKIATKLKPNISSSNASSNKKVGVVINAESYIKEQMKKLLEEGVFSNLKPADIVVDAGGTKKQDNEGTKDIGNFEVKESPDGGLSSRREGIYRYLPSENEQPNEGKKKKNNKLKIPKSQERNRATGAISMNKQNPFKRPQKTLKLKYLY